MLAVLAAHAQTTDSLGVTPAVTPSVTSEYHQDPQLRSSSDATEDGYRQIIQSIFPTSFQASSIEQYGNYPVDYSTGSAVISIPLYQIEIGSYTLPVSISYNTSGIKVQDLASTVGLGWVLNVGGVVNRQLKGKDDAGRHWDYTSEHDLYYAMAYTHPSIDYWNYRYRQRIIDTESDRYVFSFNGKSSVFRYCVTDQSIRTIPYSGVKIEDINTGGYKITDTDGTKYYFTEPENISGHPYTQGGVGIVAMSWYLTRIEPISSSHYIEFEYSSSVSMTYGSWHQDEYRGNGPAYERTEYNQLEYAPYSPDSYNSSSIQTIRLVNLSSIRWAGNSIDFSYTYDRLEHNLSATARLCSFTVTNCEGDTVRKVTFDNNHYLGSDSFNYRMMLEKLTIEGSTSSGSLEYRFSYNQLPLPKYMFNLGSVMCFEDFWGYYNGPTEKQWIPASDYSTGQSSNRSPNINYTRAGSLTKVIYPTGGSTEIATEPNRVSDGRVWGGLRLRSLTDKDADGNTVCNRTFEYESGQYALDVTSDLYTYDMDYCYAFRDFGLYYNSCIRSISQGQPLLSLTANWTSPIYYQRVTEKIGDQGKIVYQYDMNLSSLGDILDGGHHNDPIRIFSAEYNCDQGCCSPSMTEKSVYSKEGDIYKLKYSESYNYEELHVDTFRLGVRMEKNNVLISYGGITEDDGVYPFIPDYSLSDVFAFPSVFVLSSKTVTDYDHQVATTTTYSYDSALRTLEPVNEAVSTSKNESLTKAYIYPQTAGTSYQSLKDANMHVPVETTLSRAGTTIKQVKSSYETQDGMIVLSGYFEGKGSDVPELRLHFEYDAYGNLASIVKDNTMKTTFLWGYNGLYPVARIDGKDKTEVYSALGSLVTVLLHNPSDAAIYAVNSNPTLSSSALVTTYTWNPLVGTTSMRKPNLDTTYYTYDSMGRLASVKDNSQHVIESYQYYYGGTESSNYVRTRTMTNNNETSYRDTYVYYDGLGRKKETLSKGQSPCGDDLVTMTEYDCLNRPIKEWLPTTFSNSGNYIVPSAYRSAARPYYNSDDKPYSVKEYETCPSGKVLKEYGPGALWQDGGKTVETAYSGNSAGSVRKYTASDDGNSLTGSGMYAANQLFVVRTTDEDGSISYTFTDKEGKLILERKMSGITRYDTYYVYDIYGNLAFVLPPSASSVLTYGTWSINSNITLRNYAYNYRYDRRNRCIEKKIPGCDKVTMIYDMADRLISSQDGVQRIAGLSTYYEYDIFGRQTAMGTKTASGVKTPLMVNYYDTNSFYGNLGSSVAYYAYNSSAGSDAMYTNTRGLLTGTKVHRLDSPDTYSFTTLQYGERGRLVQSHSGNVLGGINHEYYTYNFNGTTATKKLVHTVPGKATQTELYTKAYDAADRLTNVTYKLNTNPTITLAANTYDAVGRLQAKSLMDADTVTYGYNIRNWLTNISSTHFTEALSYNAANGILTPSVPQWGGNVSAMSWKACNETSARTYQFTYNALGWLMAASYSGTGNYSTQYTYDKMGNFHTLKRYGLQNGGTYGLTDYLTFTYQGNQVTKIDDAVADSTCYGDFNFTDGTSLPNEYEYDENGNMTKDLNKPKIRKQSQWQSQLQ